MKVVEAAEQQKILSTAEEKCDFALKPKIQIASYQLFYSGHRWLRRHEYNYTSTRNTGNNPKVHQQENKVCLHNEIFSGGEMNESYTYICLRKQMLQTEDHNVE